MIILESMVYKKPATILNIEKAIKKYKNKYDRTNINTWEGINRLEEDSKFQKQCRKDVRTMGNVIVDNISKEFNLSIAFHFQWATVVNMWTSHYLMDTSKVNIDNFDTIIKTSQDGRIKFAKKGIMSCDIFFTSGMVNNKAFSAEEITAALLHEVGHIFAYPFIKLAYSIRALETFVDIESIRDAKMKYNARNAFVKFLARFYGDYKLSNTIIDSANKEHEKFADHFSAHYGYANELSGVLINIDKEIGKIPNKDEESSEFFKLFRDIGDIVFWGLFHNTRYPDLEERITYVTKELRKEIGGNNKLSSKDKKALQDKLNQIDNKMNKLYGKNAADSYYTRYRNDKYMKNYKTGLDLDNPIHTTFDDFTGK
nr:MAG TPA: hypothetical protein [Caudoviricetes sp.]